MDNTTAQNLAASITKLNTLLQKFGRQDSGWSGGDTTDTTTEQTIGMQKFRRELQGAAGASEQLTKKLSNLLPRRPFNAVIQKFEEAGDQILDAATDIGVKSQRSTLDFIKRSRANAEQMRKIADMHAEITSDVGKLQGALEKKNKEGYTKTFKALEDKVEQFKSQGIDAGHLDEVVRNIKVIAGKMLTINAKLDRTDTDDATREELTEELNALNLNMQHQYAAVSNSQKAQQSMMLNFTKEMRESSEHNTSRITQALQVLGAGMKSDIARLGGVIESELRNIRGSEASDHLLALRTGLSPAMLNELQQQNLRLTNLSEEERKTVVQTAIDNDKDPAEALRMAGKDNQNALIERISADASRYGYFGADAQVFMNDVMSGMKTAGMGESKMASGQYTSQALTSILGSNAQMFEMNLGDAAKEMGDFLNQPSTRALMLGLDDTQRLAVIKEESDKRHQLLKTLGMSIELQKQFNAEQRQRKFSGVVDRFRKSIMGDMFLDQLKAEGVINEVTPELRSGQADYQAGRDTIEARSFSDAMGIAAEKRQTMTTSMSSAEAVGTFALGDVLSQGAGHDLMQFADRSADMDATRRLTSTAGGMEPISKDITQFSDAMVEHTGLLQDLYTQFKPYFSGASSSIAGGTIAAGAGLVGTVVGGIGTLALQAVIGKALGGGGAGGTGGAIFGRIGDMLAGGARGPGNVPGNTPGAGGSIFSRVGDMVRGGPAGVGPDAVAPNTTPQAAGRAGTLMNAAKSIAPRLLGSLGLGTIGTLATMGGDALTTAGHEKSGAAVSTLGYAGMGAGMGMMLGPVGAAIGGGLGAAYGMFQNKDAITGMVDSAISAVGLDPDSGMGQAIESAVYASPLGLVVGHERLFENMKEGWNSLTGNLTEPPSAVSAAVAGAATTGMVLQPDGTYASPDDKTAELVELNRRQVELSEEHLKLDGDSEEKRRRENEATRQAAKYSQQARQMRDNLIESTLASALAPA